MVILFFPVARSPGLDKYVAVAYWHDMGTLPKANAMFLGWWPRHTIVGLSVKSSHSCEYGKTLLVEITIYGYLVSFVGLTHRVPPIEVQTLDLGALGSRHRWQEVGDLSCEWVGS